MANANIYVPYPVRDMRAAPSFAQLYPALPIVFYHARCFDGMAAALEAWKALKGECLLYSLDYKDPLPECWTQHNIYFVDFCPTVEQLHEWCDSNAESSRKLIILDHHTDRCMFVMDEGRRDDGSYSWDAHVEFYYDNQRSGAGLTWRYFNYDTQDLVQDQLEAPWHVRYVEDRDLWRFNLLHTKGYTAFLGTLPWTIEAWYNAINTIAPSTMIYFGGNLLAKREEELAMYAARAIILNVKDRLIAFCNAPKPYASELGSKLVRETKADYAVIYEHSLSDVMDWHVSVRGLDTGPSSCQLAKEIGGGGHRNAAGFSVAAGYERTLEPLLHVIETAFDMIDALKTEG